MLFRSAPHYSEDNITRLFAPEPYPTPLLPMPPPPPRKNTEPLFLPERDSVEPPAPSVSMPPLDTSQPARQTCRTPLVQLPPSPDPPAPGSLVAELAADAAPQVPNEVSCLVTEPSTCLLTLLLSFPAATVSSTGLLASPPRHPPGVPLATSALGASSSASILPRQPPLVLLALSPLVLVLPPLLLLRITSPIPPGGRSSLLALHLLPRARSQPWWCLLWVRFSAGALPPLGTHPRRWTNYWTLLLRPNVTGSRLIPDSFLPHPPRHLRASHPFLLAHPLLSSLPSQNTSNTSFLPLTSQSRLMS